MRLALAGAGFVLMAGMLSACGGSAEDAPTDASKGDFCDSIEKAEEAGDDEDKIDDALDEMKDTGTPEDMPDDARDGYVVLVDFFDEHKGDSDKEVEEALKDLGDEDEKKFTAFNKYVGETC